MSDISESNRPYIIGLTGNIGTGKSTIRKILQHLGAYGIDADALTRVVLQKESPAVEIIGRRFGSPVIQETGAIDRGKLAGIVFSDKQALQDLEEILHPLVITAAANLITHARLPIIVIEAVKLLESNLANMCDSVWVIDADDAIIFDRLKQKRDMQPKQIMARLANQSSPAEKIRHANVFITNNGDILNAWEQVEQEWHLLIESDCHFANASVVTAERLQQSNEILLTPGSELFHIIKAIPGEHDQIKWLYHLYPSVSNEVSPSYPQNVLDNFTFAGSQAPHNRNLTIWRLSLFEFRLIGHQHIGSKGKDAVDLSKLELIEHFGKLHMARSITIPVSTHNNEGAASLGGNNYVPLPPDHADISKSSIAGYNVFQKNLNNAYDLFTENS